MTCSPHIQWHSQHFTPFLKQSKTDQQSRGTTINFCKLTKPTCTYHNMAAYIALASHKDLVIAPLFCFSNGCPLTRLRLFKHLCRQLQQAPISIAHIASELAVQLQRQRLAPHRQPFSNWTDGVARHTGATFVHLRKYQPWDPRKQWAAPQPQAAQELTAGHSAGDKTNEIQALSRTKHTGSNSQAHTRHIALLCISLCWLVLLWVFPSHQKGFFPWEPKGPSGPKI